MFNHFKLYFKTHRSNEVYLVDIQFCIFCFSFVCSEVFFISCMIMLYQLLNILLVNYGKLDPTFSICMSKLLDDAAGTGEIIMSRDVINEL